MAKYQVAIIRRPENWKPECADDVPLDLSGPVGVLAESDDLFEAVSRAMEHNESGEARRRGRWAVVVEPGSVGRVWPAARLCTPITYVVTAIWWPDGWEPAFAVGRAELRVANARASRGRVVQLSAGGSYCVGA